MSDDGFVARPKSGGRRFGANTFAGRLRATADNGKALKLPRHFHGYFHSLRRQGYQLHISTKPDGVVVGWCERITPNGHAPADEPK